MVRAFLVLTEDDEGSVIRYRVRVRAPGLIAEAPRSDDNAHVVFLVHVSMLALPGNSGHEPMLGGAGEVTQEPIGREMLSRGKLE